MRLSRLLSCGIGFGIVCSGALAEEWRFNAGPAIRLGMDLEIFGSTFSQQNSSAGAAKSVNRAAGPSDNITSYADRTFDNGFVFIDPSTVSYGGDTWYWSYQDASQYDAAAGTLSFTLQQDLGAAGAVSDLTDVNAVRDDRLNLHDSVDGYGLTLSVERDLIVREYDRLSIAAGIVGLWGLESSMETTTFEESVQNSQEISTTSRMGEYTYVYDLMGVIPPSAPYTGTFDGPGPLIPNLPSSVSVSESSSTSTRRRNTAQYRLSNQSSYDVEAAIYECWIGPRLAFQAGAGFEILFTPYVSLNLVDGQMDQTEILDAVYSDGRTERLEEWHDHSSEMDLLLGLGAQGGIRWNSSDRWFLSATAGYDWVPTEFEVEAGPNRMLLDISGFQATLEMGWLL